MPKVFEYKCNSCDFMYHSGWGGYFYVVDNLNNRMGCSHPGEHYQVCKVLGVAEDDYFDIYFNRIKVPGLLSSKKVKERYEKLLEVKAMLNRYTGFNSDCICLDCFCQFELDVGDSETAKRSARWHYKSIAQIDERICPDCKSDKVVTVLELENHPCPRCKEGKVVAVDTGILS